MSSLGLVRALAHVHGHLGWLAVAALAHPAWLLRGGRRRASAAVAGATSLTTAAAGLGLWLYPHYRACIKHELFVESAALGWLFERKEHAAFGALAFAWVGLLAHAAAPSAPEPGQKRRLARAASVAFACAALCALAAAAAGTAVASRHDFANPGPCNERRSPQPPTAERGAGTRMSSPVLSLRSGPDESTRTLPPSHTMR